MALFQLELSHVVGTLMILLLYRIVVSIKPLHVPMTVPGPKRYPLIGYLWFAIKHWKTWPTTTDQMAKKYGKTWGGPVPNFGGLPGAYFYISDPDNLQHILKDNFDNYGKGDMWMKILGEVLGQGIFAVDGTLWKTHRKLMSHMFSRKLLRHNASVMRSKAMAVVDLMEKRIQLSANECHVDIQDIFFRLTMDVTCEVTFGVNFDSIHSNEQHPFPVAFEELTFLCQKRFLDPLFQIKRTLRLGHREQRIHELKQIVDNYAYEVIRKATLASDEPRTDASSPSDLLSLFIDHARKTKEHISDQELRDVVMNVLLAGRDTTACALAWSMFELTRNPSVVDNIVEEVNAVCGRPGENADYSYEAMGSLRYTQCVAMEVLRLHPPVTNDPRYAMGDDILPDGTQIPAGCGLDLCFYAMGRSERIWGGDALEFKPERFLNEKEPSPCRFPMFNVGPRMCLGKPLALMNMKLVMSILLPRFQFQDKLHHSGEYDWTLVEKMKGGFDVTISNNVGKANRQ